MANKKSRFSRTRIQAALVWHSVRTLARAPPWKYVTNEAAVREAPRTRRGFRLFQDGPLFGASTLGSGTPAAVRPREGLERRAEISLDLTVRCKAKMPGYGAWHWRDVAAPHEPEGLRPSPSCFGRIANFRMTERLNCRPRIVGERWQGHLATLIQELYSTSIRRRARLQARPNPAGWIKDETPRHPAVTRQAVKERDAKRPKLRTRSFAEPCGEGSISR